VPKPASGRKSTYPQSDEGLLLVPDPTAPDYIGTYSPRPDYLVKRPAAPLGQIVASSLSSGLAETLEEVHALLDTWLACAEQDRMTGEWPEKLRQGLVLLPGAATPQEFVKMLERAGV